MMTRSNLAGLHDWQAGGELLAFTHILLPPNKLPYPSPYRRCKHRYVSTANDWTGSRCAPTQRDGAIAFSRRTGSEEALGSARLLDALNGTLAQSDRVALALLCKLDDALRYELGSWISSINKPQLAQGFLKGSQ
jgi:hypothetical protein